uniref:Uncharacterized protein n=1 Tax=Knipowitschia caucasica TaxID=637954 RepID=A0AAV2JSA1_KNICA
MMLSFLKEEHLHVDLTEQHAAPPQHFIAGASRSQHTDWLDSQFAEEGWVPYYSASPYVSGHNGHHHFSGEIQSPAHRPCIVHKEPLGHFLSGSGNIRSELHTE